jgi:hypothetical protein
MKTIIMRTIAGNHPKEKGINKEGLMLRPYGFLIYNLTYQKKYKEGL